MKKLILLGLSLMMTAAVFAQKVSPKIKEGSTMNFDVNYQGQVIDFMLIIKSLGDPVKMDWDVSGTGGSYELSQKTFQNGVSFNAQTPVINGVTKFKDDETFCFISKSAYQTLSSTKAFTYSGLSFAVKDTEPFKVGALTVDATHVATADGKTEMWVMNNPDFPMVLKIKGNQNGVDFSATAIKE